MKRTLFLLACWAALGLPSAAHAVDFSLRPNEPGPGHRTATYGWKFCNRYWELTPPEKYTLTGGGDLRIQQTDRPDLIAVCRASTGAERDLFVKRDPAARDACFRTLLPSGTKDLKLVSQQDNPLPLNGLNNVGAVYTYELGGISYQATFMVNKAVEEPEKNAAPTAKPVEDYFTAVVVAPQESQPALFEAYQRLFATARVTAKEPADDQNRQYKSHGIL